MKKYLVLLISLLIMIPISVKADMGAPEIKAYKVVPKSSNGAKYYDYDFKEEGTIKSGEKIEIDYEFKHDGELYGSFSNKSKSGYVKLSDYKLANDNKDEYEALYVGKVFSKKDLDVYSGPSYIYSKTGDTLSYDDDLVVSEFLNFGTWIYVEKGDIKGFVDAADGKIGILTTGNKMNAITRKVYKEFYTLDDWTRAIVVDIKGKYTKIEDNDLAIYYPYKSATKTTEECILYKSPLEGDTEKVTTIKKGTKLKPLYSFGNYGYEAYFIKTDEYEGWIKSNVVNDLYVLSCFDNSKAKPLSEKDYPSDKFVLANNKDKKKDKEDKKSFFTPKMIIILSCVGGALVVLCALVTIIFVNKKKNKSVQE